MTTATEPWRCPKGESHAWKIDSPNGPTSQGECRKCGTTRAFANSDEASWVGNKPPGERGFKSQAAARRVERWNGKVVE